MGKRTRAPQRTRVLFKELEKRVAKDPQVGIRRLTREDVAVILSVFLDQTMHALAEFEEIYIQGFGQFYRLNRKKQTVTHPKTREVTVLAPRFDIRFKVGLEWKRILGTHGLPAMAERFNNPKPTTPTKKKAPPSIPTDL